VQAQARFTQGIGQGQFVLRDQGRNGFTHLSGGELGDVAIVQVPAKLGSGQERLGQCVHAGFSIRDVKKPSLTIKESRLTTDKAIAVPAFLAKVAGAYSNKKPGQARVLRVGRGQGPCPP
jgi:hypothetical protein